MVTTKLSPQFHEYVQAEVFADNIALFLAWSAEQREQQKALAAGKLEEQLLYVVDIARGY